MAEKNFRAVKQNFDSVELPTFHEIKGKDYVSFGRDNLYPQELIKLYDSSAIHHTCINAITDGIFGEGIEIIGDEYINTQGETIDDIFEKINLDYVLYKGYSLNVIWNKGGDKIVEIYHVPFANVRSGKLDEEEVVNEYFYSSDWTKIKKFPAKPYRAFDVTDNKGDNGSQILYFFEYTPGSNVYPLPEYVAALNDVDLDGRVSVFHNSNISNGIAPSMFLQFNNGIPTPEERRVIYAEVDSTFSGEQNAGRFFLNFADGADRGLTVTPIDNANDDYYIVLETRISSRILTAHRITSPLLLGVQTGSGFSSNAEEILVSYKHFESTVVAPKRKKILKSFGYVLKLAGFNVSITVAPKSIIVMEETTVNEAETKSI